jgi:hypothetical protein
VIRYWLDDCGLIPDRARDFSHCHHMQTGSWGPLSLIIGVKWSEHEADKSN